MEDRYFGVLAHDEARRRAAQACMDWPEGHIVRIEPPTRNKAQNALMHCMIKDIAAQWTFLNRRWDQDDVKRLLVESFAHVMREMGTPLKHDGHVVLSIDGKRTVQLGLQTADFSVQEMSNFIEHLYAWGSGEMIDWTEKR